jgi:hypothetical protein
LGQRIWRSRVVEDGRKPRDPPQIEDVSRYTLSTFEFSIIKYVADRQFSSAFNMKLGISLPEGFLSRKIIDVPAPYTYASSAALVKQFDWDEIPTY